MRDFPGIPPSCFPAQGFRPADYVEQLGRDIHRVCEIGRLHGPQGRQMGDRALRVAVKDRETNRRMVAILAEVLNGRRP